MAEILQPELAHVAGDPTIVIHGALSLESDMLTDRILSGPVFPGQFDAHDRHAGVFGPVRFSERAAGDERNPHRVEEASRYRPQVRRRLIRSIGRWASLDEERTARIAPAERAREADSNSLKAGSAGHCIEEPRVEQA